MKKLHIIILFLFAISCAPSTQDIVLYDFARIGEADQIKPLIETGADIDVQVENGATALFAASKNGHIEVVKILILHEADLDLENNNGETPLAIAKKNKHKEIVELLIKHGAKE